MKKFIEILNKIFGVTIILELFLGALSVLGYIVAIIIGGDVAMQITDFIFNSYLKGVIIATSVTIGLGLLSMYLTRQKALTFESGK